MTYADTMLQLEDEDGQYLTISAYKVRAVQGIKGRGDVCEVLYSLGDSPMVDGAIRTIVVKGNSHDVGAEVIRKIGMWSGQAA